MHELLPRNLENTLRKRLANNPSVALLGPRQVGKSTLARLICDQIPSSLFLDLERERDRAMLANLEEFFLANRPPKIPTAKIFSPKKMLEVGK